jgi:protein-S-isoprenylcysteine O-methyltransferase Ste14
MVYNFILNASLPLAALIFMLLLFITAPYGRYKQRGWGVAITPKLAWIIMEAPSAMIFTALFLLGDAPNSWILFIFFAMWESHYIHRAFIYPLMIAKGKNVMPIVIIIMGVAFNSGNAYINGMYLFSLSGGYPITWLYSPQMLIGLTCFIVGFIINRWADHVLHTLRGPGEMGYKIPHGGLYRWISCPNYFGETIEWIGWAIATWSLPGLTFAVWTFANLAPRAHAHHKWYHQHFEDYPTQRKAFIPWVW